MRNLLDSGEPWFAAAEALLLGVAVALAAGLGIRLLARRLLRDEDRAQRLSMAAFWGVVAVFGVVAVSRLFGGPAAEAGLGVAGTRFLTVLPDLVLALVLIVVGFVLAAAARAVIIRRLAPRRPRIAEPLATATGTAVVVVALLLGARQIGVQTILLDGLVLLVAAGLLLAAALAAGLGGRGYAAALAAGRHAADILTVGDLVEIDGRTGRVLRLGSTSVRLGLDGGAVAEVPHELLLRATVVVFEHDEASAPPPVADAVSTLPDERAPDRDATVAVDGPAVDGPAVDGPAVDGPAVDGPAVDDEAPTRTFARLDPGSAGEREPTRALDRAELDRAIAAAAPPAPADAAPPPTDAAPPADAAPPPSEDASSAPVDPSDEDDGGPPTQAFPQPPEPIVQ